MCIRDRIGGSAGGILTATMARKAYGDIDITLIRDTETVMVPCGIPYIYGTLRDLKKNIIPDAMLHNADIGLVKMCIRDRLCTGIGQKFLGMYYPCHG